ncbi:ArsR/SmtB family transcription factor [Desertibaculum subflavum]|uniref:ArsR/SmtB family transcription factor n=1 Tax=Desertibaculum subflavum TaxID=2268458 RepID=UPI000E664E12
MVETSVFRALADPTRRAIFERLTEREMSVGQLKAGFDVTQPAISQHLAALKDAHLVKERRAGRFAYYRVDPQGLAPMLAWLERYRAFWPPRIDRLKDVLREMDR